MTEGRQVMVAFSRRIVLRVCMLPPPNIGARFTYRAVPGGYMTSGLGLLTHRALAKNPAKRVNLPPKKGISKEIAQVAAR